MNLSAPTTITLRRPSADADLIISRHDDAIVAMTTLSTAEAATSAPRDKLVTVIQRR